MFRTKIAGEVLEIQPPVTIGEGDKAILKQTIIVKQSPETDEWSGREFPRDTWEFDILGEDEIKRHDLNGTYVGMWGTFSVQFNSKRVTKKESDPKKAAQIMYPVNIRVGYIDWTKA